MKKLPVAILSILIFLPTGTAAFAQEIIGCVNKKLGILRIASDPKKCTKHEYAISWNQTGPQGE